MKKNYVFILLILLFFNYSFHAEELSCGTNQNCLQGCLSNDYNFNITINGTTIKNPSCLSFMASPFSEITISQSQNRWFWPGGDGALIPISNFKNAYNWKNVYRSDTFGNTKITLYELLQDGTTNTKLIYNNSSLADAFCNYYAITKFSEDPNSPLSGYIKNQLGIDSSGNITRGDYFKGYVALSNNQNINVIPNFNISAPNKTSIGYNFLYYDCDDCTSQNPPDVSPTLIQYANFNSFVDGVFSSTKPIVKEAILGTQSTYYFPKNSTNCGNLTENQSTTGNNLAVIGNNQILQSCNMPSDGIAEHINIICIEPQVYKPNQ